MPDQFKRTLNYYVESGIPVIAAIRNEHIAHAITVIGHEMIEDKNKKVELLPAMIDGLSLYDSSDFITNYIIIDDNHSAYQNVSFTGPCDFYDDLRFHNAKIESFIVPLYP